MCPYGPSGAAHDRAGSCADGSSSRLCSSAPCRGPSPAPLSCPLQLAPCGLPVRAACRRAPCSCSAARRRPRRAAALTRPRRGVAHCRLAAARAVVPRGAVCACPFRSAACRGLFGWGFVCLCCSSHGHLPRCGSRCSPTCPRVVTRGFLSLSPSCSLSLSPGLVLGVRRSRVDVGGRSPGSPQKAPPRPLCARIVMSSVACCQHATSAGRSRGGRRSRGALTTPFTAVVVPPPPWVAIGPRKD